MQAMLQAFGIGRASDNSQQSTSEKAVVGERGAGSPVHIPYAELRELFMERQRAAAREEDQQAATAAASSVGNQGAPRACLPNRQTLWRATWSHGHVGRSSDKPISRNRHVIFSISRFTMQNLFCESVPILACMCTPARRLLCVVHWLLRALGSLIATTRCALHLEHKPRQEVMEHAACSMLHSQHISISLSRAGIICALAVAQQGEPSDGIHLVAEQKQLRMPR